MAKAGGSANIEGVEYELWFCAFKLAEAFFDPELTVQPQAHFITIPATKPGEDEFQKVVIDDLVCIRAGQRTYYTIKQSNSKGNWSVGQLNSEGILDDLKKQHEKDPTSILTLVSQNPSPVITHTLAYAATAPNTSQIKEFLGKRRLDEWNQIKEIISYDDERLLSLARQARIVVHPLEDLKKSIDTKFVGHVTNSKLAGDQLFFLSLEMAKKGKAVGQIEVREFLSKNGVKAKSHLSLYDINKQLKSASVSLEDTPFEFNFIKDTHVDREETQQLYDWICSPLTVDSNGKTEEPIALLVGEAGMGKTVIFRDLYIKLRNSKIPVIGIKADRVTYQNSEQFKSDLKLSEDIEKILARMSDFQEKQVVIIDQIDALSLALSADKTQLTNYNSLITRLTQIPNTRVVVSCRSFDLNYDHSLRKYKRNRTIRVKYLTIEQVKEVLKKNSVNVEVLDKELLELLQTPLHLDIFCRITTENLSNSKLRTLHDLYNEFWDQFIQSQASSYPCIISVINEITDWMYAQQVITVSDIFSNKCPLEIKYAQSQNIIFKSDNKLSFFHQTFFDYAFARFFVENKKELTKELISNHQGLFIRSKVKAVVSYLKYNSPIQYVREIKSLLLNPDIRFHIKVLIINFLGSEKQLSRPEKQLIKKIYEGEALNEVLLESIKSKELLCYLEKELHLLVNSGLDNNINKVFQVLVKNVEEHPSTVFHLLKGLPSFQGKENFIARVIYYNPEPSNNDFIAIFNDIKGFLLSKEDKFSFFHILEESIPKDPIFVKNEFEAFLAQEVSKFKGSYRGIKLDYQELKVLKELHKAYPTIGFNLIYHSLKEVVKGTANKWQINENHKLIDDDPFYSFTGRDEDDPHDDFFIYLKTRSHILENFEEEELITIVKELFLEPYTTLLALGLDIVHKHPESLQLQFFELITSNNFLASYEQSSGKYFKFIFKSTLRIIYPLLSQTQKEIINNSILSLKGGPRKYKGEDGKIKLYFSSNQYVLLNALPEDALEEFLKLKKKHQEFERRFGVLKESAPETVKVFWRESTLPTKAYEHMSLLDWEKTFHKYTGRGSKWSGEVSLSGHSQAFESYVAKETDNFYPLVEKVSKDLSVSSTYVLKGLSGLIKGNYAVEKCKAIFANCSRRKDLESYQVSELVRLTQYFVEKRFFDEEIFSFLSLVAQEEKEEYDFQDDPLTAGINSSNGAAAEKLLLFYEDPKIVKNIFEILDKIAAGKEIPVKAVVLWRIAVLNNVDKDRTLELFIKLSSSSPKVLFYSSVWSLQYLIHVDFNKLIPFFKKVINELDNQERQQSCSRLLMAAWFHDYKDSWELLSAAFEKAAPYKIGALDVAVEHFSNPIFSKKCWKIMYMFLNEDSKEISFEYRSLFRKIGLPELQAYYDFISRYVSSIVGNYRENEFYNFLLRCTEEEPEKCIELTASFSQHTRPNISHTALRDEPLQVIIQAYNAIRKYDDQNEYLEKAMDIVDQFYMIKEYRNFFYEQELKGESY